ncbi:MAG: VOC family protein [Flavobacteriales bacterium]|jgi:PhnB protein|nr:VOC family protein [Flavobacteriales bacterium]
MASTSTYLYFAGKTEKAFAFYKSVFRSEFIGEITRFSAMPAMEGQPPMAKAEQDQVMHMALPILGGHKLVGTDVLEERLGIKLILGNNVQILLEPDTRADADRLCKELAEGGEVDMPLQEMPWGDYYGSCIDQFGVQWVFNCSAKK